MALLVLVPDSGLVLATNHPRPQIRVNCSEGPVVLSSSAPLSLTVGLAAGTSAGIAADWWLVAVTPLGLYYATPSGAWNPAAEPSQIQPIHQGPLLDLLPTEVVYVEGLPPGSYTFHFGIDTLPNGQVDSAQLFFDSVPLAIAAAPVSAARASVERAHTEPGFGSPQ